MSLSIDGKYHKHHLIVRFGEEFPKPYSNREFELDNGDTALVYITSVGHPKWRKKDGEWIGATVQVEYLITQITDKTISNQLSEEAETITNRMNIELLERRMDDALARRDYESAGRIHEEMKRLKDIAKD